VARIALFGQAAFGRDVLVRLVEAGHSVCGVYAPPEGARRDPLADEAQERGFPLIRHRRFRRKAASGVWEPIPETLREFQALDADLNVLAYVTAILPPEIVDGPERGSLCFHPSLLPRFRGGAALAWQIILGETESGVTVFRPDAGVDTGPIVIQKGGIPIRDTHTAGSLYFEELYPLGVDAMLEAVAAVDSGAAVYRPQDDAQASFQGLVDDKVAQVDWSRDATGVDRLIRGCDPQPGAWTRSGGEVTRLFGSRLLEGEAGAPPGTIRAVDGDGLVVAAGEGRLRVARVRIGGAGKVAAAESGLAPGDRLG
jgi:methionyl-tRNA formyltransferase